MNLEKKYLEKKYNEELNRKIEKAYKYIDVLKESISSDFILSGSSLCLGESNDIDIYFKNEEDYKEALLSLQVNDFGKPTLNIHSSFFGKEIDKKVQLIKLISGSPQDIISSFDLYTCQNYLTSKKELHIDESNNNKEIKINLFDMKTIDRIDKYIKKGYKFTQTNVLDSFNILIRNHSKTVDFSYDVSESEANPHSRTYEINYGLLASYFMHSIIKNKNIKISVVELILDVIEANINITTTLDILKILSMLINISSNNSNNSNSSNIENTKKIREELNNKLKEYPHLILTYSHEVSFYNECEREY